MATKSLADLQAQIERLQAEANKLRDEERSGVVARIREAISTYDLTAQDLFGSASRSGAAARRRLKGSRRSAAYGDGAGNVWGGRGPRPKWLREALAQGKQLEDFAVGGGRASSSASTAPAIEGATQDQTPASGKRGKGQGSRRSKGASNGRSKPSIKYRDEAGNTWSGMGPKPKWFRNALASGKSLESLQVPE